VIFTLKYYGEERRPKQVEEEKWSDEAFTDEPFSDE
jgi:hypothetical protein